MATLQSLCLMLSGVVVLADVPINPVPREVLPTKLAEWNFERGADGWVAEHDCSVSTADGLLRIQSTGSDPYFHRPVDHAEGRMLLKIRARSRTDGNGTVYWSTSQSPRGEDKTSHFRLIHDGRWHEYEARFVVSGRLTDVRIDPGTGPGEFDIDWIRLVHEKLHPLAIERVAVSAQGVRFEVVNHSQKSIEFSDSEGRHTVDSRAMISVERTILNQKPLQVVAVELRPLDLPPVRRTIFLHHPEIQTDWIVRSSNDLTLRVARDGSVARIERKGQIAAVLAPLVHCDAELPELRLVDDDTVIRFQGEDITLSLAVNGREVSVSIDSRRVCTGPVVRASGPLEQGLLAGLEYLGRGESSSSKLDIETNEHLRFAPDPMKVTMPLSAFVTEHASVAMTWSDPQLQPLFATPNFFDATDDHRMTLRGKRINATIKVDEADLEKAILWAVKKNGLPALPQPPRTDAQQWELCLQALNGPLKNDAGWGHCAGERWTRRPYVDMASTVWRLSGQAPQLPNLVPGGAHVPNEAIYFVTGRAAEWLSYKSGQIQNILRSQQPDGSFRYGGKYRRGHFEDTATGICARPAANLLEYARMTGDRTALEAGLKTLDYMKRFRTPRGAQTWEVALHTPDQLASAYLVWAYVRGYELTGNDDYRQLARKWALSGVPFVYLWGQHPIMAYATVPVYGATNWQAPVWIGLPVQWVGGVYAYALTMLAPHDDSLHWNHLARGILIAAEQMQYPDGPYAGLLPDAFVLSSQQRLPARINPSALVSLRRVLNGQLDSLAVANDGEHRVVAPFPVSLRNGQAHIRGKAGVRYQILVDGKRIVDVESQGDDSVSF